MESQMRHLFNPSRAAAAAVLALTLVLAQGCADNPYRTVSGDVPMPSHGQTGTFSALAGGY